MHLKKFNIVLATLLLALGLSCLGCANNPTVPLPPPDVTVISTTSPDLDGFVTVTGDAEAAEPDSIVLLFNEATESGVMETAAMDGSFEAVIAAVSGNILSLQYKLDDTLSRTEYIVVQ